MKKLLISQVMSLHPNAASTSSGVKLETHPTSSSTSPSPSSRMCLMGCLDAKPSDLRRFPVHDLNRCNHWLRYFRISDQLLTKLGGLHKLRICHKHFYNPQTATTTSKTTTATATRQSQNQRQRQSHSQSQVQVMARTRIKMTPLRKTKQQQQFNSSNGNGTATATTTATTIINGTGTGKPLMDDATTIELVETPIEVVAQQQKKHQHQQQMMKKNAVTTITLPSSVSVPPPPPPLQQPPQRSHSICSSASSDVQSINSDYEASSLENLENGRKRKLYVITEKFDEKTPNKNSTDLSNGGVGGLAKKRKMFVVVEQEKDGQSKKLMIMTDKQQNKGGGPPNNLSEKLEKLLPEILNRIQTKELQQQLLQQQQQQAQPQAQQQQKQQQQRKEPLPPQSVITSTSITNKSPITLPPKKNPTNFIKVEQQALNHQTDIVAATSPHSVTILPAGKDDQLASNDMETNINLSPDFRFLMKILPKLEQLPEPHKQDVKRSIQIFVEKSYSIYGKKD